MTKEAYKKAQSAQRLAIREHAKDEKLTLAKGGDVENVRMGGWMPYLSPCQSEVGKLLEMQSDRRKKLMIKLGVGK